ncbi:MAG TPA: PqqD family protein [Candidatus Intestinimonas stercoravium]|uniref:PqqD family protein n=1 Tax=uncultured Intestinimonas sp. TaxID=1689265 RepID=UPI001F88EF95|nr:PqqD family protein [uncultured Intestinimonas sp.]HJA63646.1 PqqD family protein [Candidatus Intestinimonas stercoravium]
MRVDPDFIVRDLMGECILIPSGEAAARYSNAMMSVNEMGKRILELLPRVESEEQLTAELLEEYEVEPETLRADVREFLGALREHGVLLD